MEFKISIIIPVYNLENYIERTLESVCFQLSSKVELIVVDDGSKDSSLRKIKTYLDLNKVKNVNVLTGENKGCIAARNEGIAKAKGEYLFFLDGDDVLYDGTITKVLKILDTNSPDAIIGKYEKINTQGIVLYSYNDKYITPKTEDLSSDFILEQCLLKNMVMLIGTVFYSRKIIDSIELVFGDKNFNGTYGEELEFYFRFLANSSKITFIDTMFLGYTAREGSVINSIDNNPLEVLENYIPRMLSLKSELGNKVSNNILRLFDSTLLPGLILSLSISALYNNKEVPRIIINKLKKVSFIDTVMKKKKRGLGLYLGSLALYISPRLFLLLLKIFKVEKRF